MAKYGTHKTQVYEEVYFIHKWQKFLYKITQQKIMKQKTMVDVNILYISYFKYSGFVYMPIVF